MGKVNLFYNSISVGKMYLVEIQHITNMNVGTKLQKLA